MAKSKKATGVKSIADELVDRALTPTDLLPPLGDEITEQHRAAIDAEAVKQSEENFGSLHLTGVSSWSISEDHQTCMVVFTVQGDDGDAKFALTYPADKARWLAGFFSDVGRAAASRNVPQGQLLQHMIGTYDIGHANQPLPDGQNIVGVTFDKQTPSEYTWVMGNIAALKFCYELTERTIKPRLTPKEREMWIQVQRFIQQEVPMPPPGSKIIRPQ